MPNPVSAPVYSLVVPAYEEASLIEQSLQQLADYLKSVNLHGQTELIVVAALGKDNTAELANKQAALFAAFQLIQPGPKVGKGRDVRLGMLAAKGQYILFMDADLATPLKYIEPAFQVLSSGQADVVIGVRNLWKIHKTLKRKVMSVMANVLTRLMLLPKVPDSQCGFKAFTRTACQDIFQRLTITGWGFDMELLVIAEKHKLRVVKLPIVEWSDPKLESGLVGESPLAAAINTIKEMRHIRQQRRRGVYQ